jgi:hypothetical protein
MGLELGTMAPGEECGWGSCGGAGGGDLASDGTPHVMQAVARVIGGGDGRGRSVASGTHLMGTISKAHTVGFCVDGAPCG